MYHQSVNDSQSPSLEHPMQHNTASYTALLSKMPSSDKASLREGSELCREIPSSCT
jgi:hypothetical protein